MFFKEFRDSYKSSLERQYIANYLEVDSETVKEVFTESLGKPKKISVLKKFAERLGSLVANIKSKTPSEEKKCLEILEKMPTDKIISLLSHAQNQPHSRLIQEKFNITRKTAITRAHLSLYGAPTPQKGSYLEAKTATKVTFAPDTKPEKPFGEGRTRTKRVNIRNVSQKKLHNLKNHHPPKAEKIIDAFSFNLQNKTVKYCQSHGFRNKQLFTIAILTPVYTEIFERLLQEKLEPEDIKKQLIEESKKKFNQFDPDKEYAHFQKAFEIEITALFKNRNFSNSLQELKNQST